jgi:hypothetical protein
MELALIVIGQMASRDERCKTIDFQAGCERRAGTPWTELFHTQFEGHRVAEVARTSRHCDFISIRGSPLWPNIVDAPSSLVYIH